MDDEPAVRSVVRDMLEANGYATLDTGDPAFALRIARSQSQPIHLLLTDVVMPLMHGRELAEQNRLIRSAIKTLYMSAYSTDTVEDYGIRLAPGGPFVVKPFTTESLAPAVRTVLDYRSPFVRPPALNPSPERSDGPGADVS